MHGLRTSGVIYGHIPSDEGTKRKKERKKKIPLRKETYLHRLRHEVGTSVVALGLRAGSDTQAQEGLFRERTPHKTKHE